MLRTKFKYENIQRAITQKLSKRELWFLCTALGLDEIYPLKSFEDMHRTKFKYESKQRAITRKLSRQELWFLCTALPLDEIYPPTKFHNHT